MNTVAKTTIAAVITGLSFMGASSSVLAAGDKEKCYGVVKAGKNDCATKVSSCVGTSKTDSQKDAFVAVPKGLCEKLTGGSLKSPAS